MRRSLLLVILLVGCAHLAVGESDRLESGFDVKAEYVSPAFDGYGSIYRITISGVPLNQDDLFSNGINGFRYDISISNKVKPEYDAKAYPLFGAEYKEEGDTRKKSDPHNILFSPKKTSFYWNGPSTSVSNWKIKIQQRAYDFTKNTDYSKQETEISLPDPVKEPINLKDYTISFEKPQVTTYRNGVCATPFKVYIKNRSNNEEAPKEVYSRLFFYKNPKGSDHPEIIGCDPDGNSCKLAIIPAGDAGLTGEPIYHSGERGTDTYEGKVFYVFSGYKATKENDTNVITAVLVDGSRHIVNSQNLEVISRSADVEIVWGKGQNMSIFYRDVSFSDNSEISVPGNGRLDYVFTDKEKEKLSYIIPLLPEGANERSLSARYNLSKFKVGFYLIPPQTGGAVTKLSVTDRTATLYNTFDKNIYAYIFDIYGRHNDIAPLYHDNKMVYTGEGELNWRSEDTCELAGERDPGKKPRMTINVANALPYPVKFRLKNSVYNDNPEVPDAYLIFAPHTVASIATHLSRKDIDLQSNIKVYRLTGPYSQIMDEINDVIKDSSIMAEIGTGTQNEIIIKGRYNDNNKGFFINQESSTAVEQKAVNSIEYRIVFLEDEQKDVYYSTRTEGETLRWYNFDAMWYLDNGRKLKYEHNNEQY